MPLPPLPPRFIRIGEQVLTVIWIGSLWTIGFIVAPTLFQVLDDRALAGMIAGRLFSIESYLGLVCGGLLLLFTRYKTRSERWFSWRTALLATMLAIIVVGEFVLQPMLATFKAQGLNAEFARWHGVSASLYLLNSVLGIVVVATTHQGN
ncbi:MAG: DUF4149 domain-containing protein [Candidatus Competibacteraceae bacterium]|nr:DUF4149 domain-containing protein [Candidatus Competibacteraceae bacterium]